MSVLTGGSNHLSRHNPTLRSDSKNCVSRLYQKPLATDVLKFLPQTFRDTAACREMVLDYTCLWWGSANEMYDNRCGIEAQVPRKKKRTSAFVAFRTQCRHDLLFFQNVAVFSRFGRSSSSPTRNLTQLHIYATRNEPLFLQNRASTSHSSRIQKPRAGGDAACCIYQYER